MHEGGEESMEVQTLLQGVRCADHTLQLAILDALDEPGPLLKQELFARS
jgi:hypothetical protein